jgi:hypothetical protein
VPLFSHAHATSHLTSPPPPQMATGGVGSVIVGSGVGHNHHHRGSRAGPEGGNGNGNGSDNGHGKKARREAEGRFFRLCRQRGRALATWATGAAGVTVITGRCVRQGCFGPSWAWLAYEGLLGAWR